MMVMPLAANQSGNARWVGHAGHIHLLEAKSAGLGDTFACSADVEERSRLEASILLIMHGATPFRCLPRRLVADYHNAGLVVQASSLLGGDAAALASALRRIIYEPLYRNNTAKLSARLRAQPGNTCSRVRRRKTLRVLRNPPCIYFTASHRMAGGR